MAFTDTSILLSDIQTMETEFGTAATVTVAGTALPCLVDVVSASERLEMGGFLPGYVGRFYLRSNAGTAPGIGDEVTIGGVVYRVGPTISTDPDGVGAWYQYKELT